MSVTISPSGPSPQTATVPPTANRWRAFVLYVSVFTIFGPLIGGLACPFAVATVFPYGRPTDFNDLYGYMSISLRVLSDKPLAFLFLSYFMGVIPALLTGLVLGSLRLAVLSERKHLSAAVATGFVVSFLFATMVVVPVSTIGLSLKLLRFGAIYGAIGAIAASACYGLTIWLSALFRSANENPASDSGQGSVS